MRNVRQVEGAFSVGNLIGVPSVHYDPHFAQVVDRALIVFKPTVVALELPDGLMDELEWASAVWPGPVTVASTDAFFPFVPGDSIFEAYRLATAASIAVVLVDLPAVGPPPTPPMPSAKSAWVGTELVRGGAELFLETIDTLVSAEQPER